MKTEGQILVKLNEICERQSLSDEQKEAWCDALEWVIE